MVESRNSKDDIKLKSRGEEGEMLWAIGKAIPDRYKGSRNERRGDPNTKAQGVGRD
jgi:hypothetical protein